MQTRESVRTKEKGIMFDVPKCVPVFVPNRVPIYVPEKSCSVLMQNLR